MWPSNGEEINLLQILSKPRNEKEWLIGGGIKRAINFGLSYLTAEETKCLWGKKKKFWFQKISWKWYNMKFIRHKKNNNNKKQKYYLSLYLASSWLFFSIIFPHVVFVTPTSPLMV